MQGRERETVCQFDNPVILWLLLLLLLMSDFDCVTDYDEEDGGGVLKLLMV